MKLLVLACAGLLAPAALAAHHEVTPVKTVTAAKLGKIVANTHGLALYTWGRERDGKVRCTGACANQWPPLLVMKGDMVVKHVKGVMGTLGTVMRPDGHVQVTLDRHPLYTHAGDMKMEALGNGVAGWSVVKA
ncbi:MAG: COG4315 family predicted lipoprotein [Gaiellaceae bacterium]